MGKLLYSETDGNGGCNCVHEDTTQMMNTATYGVPCPCPLDGMIANPNTIGPANRAQIVGTPQTGNIPQPTSIMDFGLSSQDRRTFSNFIDGETMDYKVMADSDQWSNHPGFIGGTWWKDFWSPKKAEKERYDSAVADKKNKYKLGADIDCDTIDDTISKIDNAIVRNANSGGKDRVVSRESRALENRRLDFKARWEADDCSQERLDAQKAEFEQNIQGMFNQANLRSAERKTDYKTLQSVALGVGALVIGAVVWIALKK
jgi:hypothetical protein